MASIKPMKNKSGVITSYKVRVCVGRDPHTYKQIWRTCTLPRPEGLTPAKERKEIERQADAWEQKQKDEYERTREKVSKANVTLASFITDIWLKNHVDDPKKHSPGTIAFYEYMSKDIINYFGLTKKLSSVDGETIAQYVKWLNNDARTKRGEPYSDSTVTHHFNTLRNVLEYARHYKYISGDPIHEMRPEDKPKKKKSEIDFLPPEEAKRFLRCLQDEPLFWQCLEYVLILTGLRRGEAVGLQWGDINSDNLTMTVQRNVTLDKNSETKYHIGTPKNGESRTVPITTALLSMLRRLKHEQEKDYGAVLPTAFVFCRATDPYTPLYPTEPTRWQRKFVKRHNLPRVSPHDLRHTAASLALEAGASLKEIQVLLGHSDPATTMRFYAGITEQAQRRTVQGIENLLNDATHK